MFWTKKLGDQNEYRKHHSFEKWTKWTTWGPSFLKEPFPFFLPTTKSAQSSHIFTVFALEISHDFNVFGCGSSKISLHLEKKTTF